MRYQAHTQDVADLRFSFDGSILISVGKYDRSIVQWNIDASVKDTHEVNAAAGEGAPGGGKALQKANDAVLANEQLHEIQFELAQGEDLLQFYPERPREVPIGLLNDDSPLGGDTVSEGEREKERAKFRWLANIVEPSQPFIPAPNADIPNVNVRLQHVYGYETTSLRNNLSFLSSNSVLGGTAGNSVTEIVYTCAGYGIVSLFHREHIR